MSFGRPPSTGGSFTPAPPDRGSFPLDHDGECKELVKKYLLCLRQNKNDNGVCRELSRAYLECRMERGLMEKDDWVNLGFGQEAKAREGEKGEKAGQSQRPNT
ncbi:uncharacterized protein VTP21DRAFT_4207 [Calcarisporiella thermophila]|uniref:uncharacterized protein n=1 Tax=Calcarisporiella thermophila TaxID=911321 RepID=UPI003744ACFE